MKKFLKKKPVMIAFVIAAVVMIAVYIGMLVRPISYGFNYTYKETYENSSVTVKCNFKNDKVIRITEKSTTEEGSAKMVTDFWTYRDGDTVYIIGTKKFVSNTEYTDAELEEDNENDFYITSKAEYEVAIENIKEAKEKGETEYKIALGLNTKSSIKGIGLFKIQEEGDEETVFKNTQAIIFTVVHGVVTVAVVVFAALSVVAVVKSKKKK